MTVSEYLEERGITLIETCYENGDHHWSEIDASTAVGKDITKLWFEARSVLDMCHDMRNELTRCLVHQCDIWWVG